MATHTHALIADIRSRAGLSQAELARRAGLPRSVMNAYEHGRREPSAAMLARILAAAGFELVASEVTPPTDPVRAGKILAQVLELAEALPYRPKPNNSYPPLVHRLA